MKKTILPIIAIIVFASSAFATPSWKSWRHDNRMKNFHKRHCAETAPAAAPHAVPDNGPTALLMTLSLGGLLALSAVSRRTA